MTKLGVKKLFIFLTLVSSLLISGISFWLYDYISATTKEKLETLSQNEAQKIRYQLTNFYDQTSYAYETTKQDPYKKLAIAQLYFEKYGDDALLLPLQKLLNTDEQNYEIYLINQNLIIERTTFKNDLGLDFKNIPNTIKPLTEEFSDPKRIDLGKPYHEASTGDFKRYILQLSKDKRYIIELGQSFRNRLSFLDTMRGLKRSIPSLKTSYVFSIFSNDTQKAEPWTVKQSWSSDLIGKNKNEINKTENATQDLKKILLKIDPSSATLFNASREKLYPYLKKIANQNKVSEAFYTENGRNLHMIILPYQTYYHASEGSYSLLVMEFDETDSYREISITNKILFSLWGLLIFFITMMGWLGYQRLIVPIALLEKRMKEKKLMRNGKILKRNDEMASIVRTYNWLLQDLNYQITNNKTLLNQFKEFTANAVHQIRTPLSVIKIALESLDDSHNKEAVLYIRSSAVTMEHLYDSLSFTLQNNSTQLPIQRVDIKKVLQERIKLFTPVANSLDTSIEVKLHTNAEFFMSPRELEYLIDNNLSNSLKYGTSNKEIFVTLDVAHNELILGFESYGKPISDTNVIFERYIRLNSDKQGGGLGLDIVKSIAKRYNIIIQITYEDGKNIFRYFFPIKSL